MSKSKVIKQLVVKKPVAFLFSVIINVNTADIEDKNIFL
jgi:hypothetical protein